MDTRVQFSNARVIVLDEIPDYTPEDSYILTDPDWVAHIECHGANFHVVTYRKGIAVCSNSRCIINKIGEQSEQ